MMDDEIRDKWDRRWREADAKPLPAAVLGEYAHLLPARGDALDLACGQGGNALFLARRGLQTEAWDISEAAISRLSALASGLPLKAAVRDVEALPPAPASFDVIVVSHFLYRPLLASLAAALRPGGLIYYQTFTVERVPGSHGPRNPDYLLKPNELLDAFKRLRILAYREEGLAGDLARGVRNLAMLVARREPG